MFAHLKKSQRNRRRKVCPPKPNRVGLKPWGGLSISKVGQGVEGGFFWQKETYCGGSLSTDGTKAGLVGLATMGGYFKGERRGLRSLRGF